MIQEDNLCYVIPYGLQDENIHGIYLDTQLRTRKFKDLDFEEWIGTECITAKFVNG